MVKRELQWRSFGSLSLPLPCLSQLSLTDARSAVVRYHLHIPRTQSTQVYPPWLSLILLIYTYSRHVPVSLMNIIPAHRSTGIFRGNRFMQLENIKARELFSLFGNSHSGANSNQTGFAFGEDLRVNTQPSRYPCSPQYLVSAFIIA